MTRPLPKADLPRAQGARESRKSSAMALHISRHWGLFLFLPSLLLIFAIVVYPLARGISLSFFYNVLNRPEKGTPFIGLQNYAALLQDKVFWIALKNTTVWVVVGTSVQFLLGLITALALNRKIRGRGVAQTVVLLPWVMPTVVAAHMWSWLLDGQLGVINDLLMKVGLLSKPFPWLADPRTALLSALIVAVWKGFPFFTIFLLAGLQGVMPELYEAAAVDGAGLRKQFFKVTLPLLRPVIVTAVILRVIGMVNSPDILLVLTRGGPGQVTQVLPLYTFTTAYERFNLGYASAISVVMLLILVVFAFFYFRASGVGRDSNP